MTFNWIYIGTGIVLLGLFVWMYRRQTKFVKDLTTEKHAEEVYGLTGVEKPKFGETIRAPRDRFRASVEILRKGILDLRQSIGDARLAAASEDDVNFYLGYLREHAEAVAAGEGTKVSPAMLVPLSAEANRLLGNGKEDFLAGEPLLDAAIETAAAADGRSAAKADREADGEAAVMTALHARFTES
jgi:hypothetical protein